MLKDLLNSRVKYVKAENFFISAPNGIAVDRIQINDLAQHDLLLVNASDEDHGQGHHEIFTKRLIDLGHPYVLLTGDPRAHDPKHQIFWYQDSYDYCLSELERVPVDCDRFRDHVVACVNGLTRPHRVRMFLNLRASWLWDDMIFSMSAHGQLHQAARADDVQLTDDEMSRWQEYLERKKGIFHPPDFAFDPGGERVYHDDAYLNTYIHIVNETSCMSEAHTTEKTWKPIAAGQMFLIYGNVHTVQMLRSQGVDVFDDFIDHNYYDNEPDTMQRCQKIVKLAEHLAKQDLPGIWAQTALRRVANVEKFWGQQFRTYHYRELLDHLRPWLI